MTNVLLFIFIVRILQSWLHI